MKILSAIAALLLCTLTIYSPRAVAEAASVYALNGTEAASLLEADADVYARIFSESAVLYSDEKLSDAIFTLPLTYYVKVLAYSERACRVIYCYEDYDYARGVVGYAPTPSLTFVSVPPTTRSFPNVFPEFEGNGTFYKNNRFDSFYPASDQQNADAFFYGYYTRGNERYCYVLRGGKFGYYSADVFGKIEIPPHPDPEPLQKTLPPEENSSETETKTGFFSSDANKAIFIAVSCVIAISAVYLMFLPKRKGEALSGEEEDYPETDD